MLTSAVSNMNRVLSEEEKLEQLDQLWDMYASGSRSELFNSLCILPTEDLILYETNNIGHEIMVGFLVDYRQSYGNL